jgi:hypothetical protein
LQPAELLFLDTETTGLVGGTGSLAFLVGVAWWTDAGLQIQQLFLTRPGTEIPLLAELTRLTQLRRAVVTFNGNGFDLPLLRTRALMNRVPDPFSQLVSLDLLPAVRRLWGRRLPNCRQQTAETWLCQRPRGPGDIEGSYIPQVYFQFLQNGDHQLLPNVIRHNRRDMEGMACLFAEVIKRVAHLAGGLQNRASGDLVPWQDAWANGRIQEAWGDKSGAAGWVEVALQGSGLLGQGDFTDPFPELFLVDAVRILKRTAAWSLVEKVLQAGLDRFGQRPWLHREAAILYEHRLQRLDLAWQHAQKLGEPVRLRRLRHKLAPSAEE